MKRWVSKNFWWASPIVVGFLFFILLESYTYLPIPLLYHLQGLLVFILGLALLIYIPVFFPVLFFALYRNFRGKNRSYMIWFLLVGPFIFFSILDTSHHFLSSKERPLPHNFDKMKFDKELWSSNELTGDEFTRFRQSMAADLIKNHLPGIKCEDIVDLLGHPNKLANNDKHRQCSNFPVKLTYSLGPSQRMMNFLEWDVLEITISEEGLFERASVYSTD